MDDRKSPLIKVAIFGLLILVVAGVAAFFVLGLEGLSKMFNILIGIVILGGILAFIVGVLVWLFTKRKVDVLAKRNKGFIDSCKASKNPIKQELWFRGDSFLSTRKIGNVVGVCIASTAPEHQVIIGKDKKKSLRSLPDTVKDVVFIAFRGGFPFAKPKLFIAKESDIGGGFKSLSASKIFLSGTTFAATLYDMYFLSHHWKDTTFIDKTVKEDCQRYTLQEYLREMKTHVDAAVDLDPRHVKVKEITRVDDVPLNR